MASQAEILERVNAFAGFRLVAKLKFKQDLPLDVTPKQTTNAFAEPYRETAKSHICARSTRTARGNP